MNPETFAILSKMTPEQAQLFVKMTPEQLQLFATLAQSMSTVPEPSKAKETLTLEKVNDFLKSNKSGDNWKISNSKIVDEFLRENPHKYYFVKITGARTFPNFELEEISPVFTNYPHWEVCCEQSEAFVVKNPGQLKCELWKCHSVFYKLLNVKEDLRVPSTFFEHVEKAGLIDGPRNKREIKAKLDEMFVSYCDTYGTVVLGKY
jgi:hypothetical protein